jgi:signal transduction histidine kinase
MKYLSTKADKYEPLNLTDMIDEVAILLMASIYKKHVIDFELDSDLPHINGVPQQLKQVVINLVINASHAIENKHGKIRIVTRTSACGRNVELAVLDNGCGMDAAILPNIFDETFTTKENGTGVGLNSVHSIVQKHGGSIFVDSSPNQGAIFTVSLPIT